MKQIGEAPAARAEHTITLEELERRVVAEAAQKCNDLRFMLSGSPAHIEARVAEQRPHFRTEAFDRLTAKYQVID